MDLNLDNYSLNDLLSLFKLPENFTSKELKEARKLVVAVHPDKCNLDKSYFLFFHKAYCLLYQVHQFKHRSNASMDENMSFKDITDGMDETDKRQIISVFTSKSNFNEEFNDLFDKYYVQENDGHGDWLKSSDDLDVSYETRKQESRAVTVRKIEAASSSSYTDLKSAYTTDTVLGVSESDYLQKYKNIEDLKQERNKDIKPLSKDQAEKIIKEDADEEEGLATERAFKLMQQTEINQKNQKLFWGQLLSLK